MSPRGSPDPIAVLRQTIAQIERGETRSLDGPDPRGRAIRLGSPGFSLDQVLGAGLRTGTLHEVAPASARDEGAASRFAVAVAVCGLRLHAALVWIVDEIAAGESGSPYRPGLQTHGLDPDRLIVVRTRGAQQTLWAAEEALRGSAFVVLVELWGGRTYGLASSRRLVLAARHKGATALLLHAGVGADTRQMSTGCDTRLVVSAQPSRRLPAASGLPVPGPPAFGLRLDKARSAVRDVDPHRLFPLGWNAEQRCFHDHDLSVALAAAPADRPARLH